MLQKQPRQAMLDKSHYEKNVEPNLLDKTSLIQLARQNLLKKTC